MSEGIKQVRAKYFVQSVTEVLAGGTKTEANPKGIGSTFNIKLSVVMDGSDENKDFFKWTPSGVIELNVVKKETGEFFEIGEEYYLDFTKAP